MTPAITPFRKEKWVRILPTHPDIQLLGNWERHENWMMGPHAVGRGRDARAVCRLRDVSKIKMLVRTHRWGPVVTASVDMEIADAFDTFTQWEATEVRTVLDAPQRADHLVALHVRGQNPASAGDHVVFGGLFIPADENPYAESDPHVERFTSYSDDDEDRDEVFQKLQQEMVDEWTAAIYARGETLEDVTEQRTRAYVMRLGEALVYAPEGGRMLDIGAGYLLARVVDDVILAKGIDYWIRDIDDRVVENDRDAFVQRGLDPEKVQQGENTDLPYPDGHFDLVFSSHCLEHSRDLPRSFAEIHRILRPGGHVFFAVPFGWDTTREHIYALSAHEWVAMAEQAGFEVRNVHIGNVYPEQGHDVAIAARRPEE